MRLAHPTYSAKEQSGGRSSNVAGPRDLTGHKERKETQSETQGRQHACPVSLGYSNTTLSPTLPWKPLAAISLPFQMAQPGKPRW